jgi:hypothetical protein
MGLSVYGLFDTSNKQKFEHFIYETQKHPIDFVISHLKLKIYSWKDVSSLNGNNKK